MEQQSVCIYDIQQAQKGSESKKGSGQSKAIEPGGRPFVASAEAVSTPASPNVTLYKPQTTPRSAKERAPRSYQGARERQQPSREDCEATRNNNDEVDYEALKALPYYHGFVARQDMSTLLKNEGDYIVRITEVEAARGLGPVKYDLILSLLDHVNNDVTTAMTMDGAPNSQPNTKLRNVVIRKKKSDRYCIEKRYTFSTVSELIKYYADTNTKTEMKVYLKTPILHQKWEFKHSDLDFTGGKMLGQGAYGFVRSGRLTLPSTAGGGGVVNVAVKVQKLASGKDEKIGKEKMKEQMREARIMRLLENKNIVKLYGVAVMEQPLYIILELINGGELKKYLMDQKAKGQRVGVLEKVHMARGAAVGLAYLHREGYIHRDIAARNCLYVPGEKLAKLSDFGLSRRALEYTVTKGGAKLPTKWLAPETLDSLTFYDKSDVYSFGVMMYEIFVDGEEPWPKVPKAAVRASVLRGDFMQMPADCPPKVAKFVHKHIYVKEPLKRTTSQAVAALLEAVQTEMEGGGGAASKAGFFSKFFASKEKNRSLKEKRNQTQMTQLDE